MMAKIAPRFAPDGLIKIVTKTRNPADALWSTQRRLLTLTAGPLGAMHEPMSIEVNPITDMKEIYKNYLKRLNEQREEELTKSSDLIQNFIDFCHHKNIELTRENFDYVVTIGIVAEFPNLVSLLNKNIISDKEDLFDVSVLEKEYKKRFVSGYYYSENYVERDGVIVDRTVNELKIVKDGSVSAFVLEGDALNYSNEEELSNTYTFVRNGKGQYDFVIARAQIGTDFEAPSLEADMTKEKAAAMFEAAGFTVEISGGIVNGVFTLD
jgi:hypothetical protein